MALMRLNFKSETLGRHTYVNVILPQNGAVKPFPVLYLLHGLTDDQEAWLRNTPIERYAEGRDLAIVMPATDRGFYTDTTYGIKHFTYISEELPALLRQYLPLSDRREDTYAAGLSMGGYGALKLALRNPGRFSFAASLSGALVCREMLESGIVGQTVPDLMPEMELIFGKTVKPEDDVFRLLETASPKPRLFVCCGEKDELMLYPINNAMRKYAAGLGYNVKWRSDSQAGHSWAYWDLMIQEVLDELVN
jgi:S-formylglutathione hydrolase FrmB